MVIYLGRMCQFGLHPLHWTRIGILKRLLAAEPRRTAGCLFTCQYLCGTILVTPYSMVWNWRISRARTMPSYCPSCSLPFCPNCFPFIFFYSMGWYCGAGVFGLIGRQSHSPSLSLPTFSNNNNNNNRAVWQKLSSVAIMIHFYSYATNVVELLRVTAGTHVKKLCLIENSNPGFLSTWPARTRLHHCSDYSKECEIKVH